MRSFCPCSPLPTTAWA
uniref:Uncharacterized protein n=1 Tax=Anguilla anguilla TaxID=7936 RepID=A0A0E9TDW8_ANGAN